MKLDIPYYIRQVLREQRMVYVPGIGTFHLKQSASTFNSDKTVLSPPSLNIQFSDDDSSDSSLLNYILDTGYFDENKVEKKLEEFTLTAFNKILNVDSFLIEGIGKLSKKDGNDKVVFEPHTSSLTREFKNLVPINLAPISRISDHPVIQSNSTPITAPLKESGSFWPRRILIFSLLFIGSWFIYQNYFNQDTSDSGVYNDMKSDKEDSDEKKFEEQEKLNALESKKLNDKYQEVDQLIDPIENSNIEDIPSLNNTPESKNKKEDISTMQKESTDSNENSSKETINKEIDSKATKKIDTPTKTSNSTPIKTKSSSKNKHADIIPESGECIIVVGSFIKSINAVNMIDFLQRRGYKVFRGEYNGFTRVGLKYDCANEDLEEYLHDIRFKLSRKAWYLDPDLDVPYRF